MAVTAPVRRVRATLVALSLACIAPAALAQSVQPTTLRAPVGRLDESFTRITSVRELADGRLLVADGGEDMRLAIVDWRAGTVRTLGREGAGPGEYRSVGRLVPLGGDSTLLEDRRTGRWLIVDGDRIVGAIPYAAERRRALPIVGGADRGGRVLTTHVLVPGRDRDVPAAILGPTSAESLLVLLERAASPRADTVARLSGGFLGARRLSKPVTPGGAPVTWFVDQPLAVPDQALLFPDGWIAIVRASPYRVEWRAPDGRASHGPPLPFARVPVDDRQKRLAMRREFGEDADFTPGEMPPWPAVLPPLAEFALHAAPDGRLVVERMADATRPGRFHDVVDRAGRLAGRLVLRPSERLVGFGRRSAYVVETDEDGLQTLRRHPWP